MIPIGLVHSIHDPTEVAIQKMIEASQRMITINCQGQLGGMNPVIKKHFKLQIKTLLQNAPRDADKLEWLLKIKERQNEEARHIEETQWLATEIEMLKVVLDLVASKRKILLVEKRASSIT
jgi:hypothetical protein